MKEVEMEADKLPRKVMRVTYAASLTDICEINSSFDRGILRVAYPGLNRNNSHISKEAFEKAAPTRFNCPLVCNYNRDEDKFGGHDVELVRDKDGTLTLINATDPVGVVPESAGYWWELVTEPDGSEHEYFCTDVIFWKRQEAYKKIKRDGITAQSMEITIKDGEEKDGVIYIYDFEFTAFALIGVEPCFESASVELFARQHFREQFTEMMKEFKECFSLIGTSDDDNDNTPKTDYTEGGKGKLQEKTELAAKYGIDTKSLDFSLEDFTLEELEEKFKSMTSVEPERSEEKEDFALTSNIRNELSRVLSELDHVSFDWCDEPFARYIYEDSDIEAGEVYGWDRTDWLLYGFKFSLDGDAAKIDAESKKRKKYIIADFDEGGEEGQNSPFMEFCRKAEERLASTKELEVKYEASEKALGEAEAELEFLRKFKQDTESAAKDAAREEVFTKFGDLSGVEAFETLRENCADYDVETLEEKCYAIRGRQAQGAQQANFNLENKTPKLKVETAKAKHEDDEPYGDLFIKYGSDKNN